MSHGTTLEALNATSSANNFTLSGDRPSRSIAAFISSAAWWRMAPAPGTLVKTGTGTLTLGNTGSTYSGGTIINNGTIAYGANASLGTGPISLNGGTLSDTNSAEITNNHAITIGANGGTINVSGNGAAGTSQFYIDTTNTLLGSGTLTVTGNGTLTTTGAGNVRVNVSNTFSGNVVLQNGGIFEDDIAGFVASSGTFIIGNQGELAVNVGATLPNAINVVGGSSSVLSFLNGNTGVFSGPITLNANATIGLRDWYNYGAETSGVISGVISGNGFGITTNPGSNVNGVLTLTASNTYTGATVIAANTSIQLGNGGTTGALSNSSAITDNGTFTIDRSNSVTQGTDFSSAGIAGSGGFTQAGTGTTTLNGSNSYIGTTAVNAGTLDVSGIQSGDGSVTLGNTASTNATLNIQPNSSVTASGLFIGNNATAPGAVYQTGGSLTLTNVAGGNDISIGNVASGYGYYSLSGGTVATNEVDVGGLFNASTGVMDMSGGTLNDAGWITVGRGGTTSSGVLNITGGAVNLSAATGNIGLYWGGAGGQVIMNIGGGAGAATVTQSTTTGYQLVMSEANNAGLSEVNLLTNGTLQIGKVTDNNANTTALLDFNGGTLKANLAQGAYLTSADMSVYVYGNGGTIDNNGVAITIGNALLAPTGNGANSNPTVSSGGSGYIGAPMVTATGAGGTGATAYATVSGGVVTGIVVTNPGTGYTGPLGFVLTGGGGTGATIGSVTPTADTSGGMTFQGSGTTTLAGANTYTGATAVTAGTLNLTGSLTGSSVATSGTGILTESSAGAIAGSGSTFTQGSTGTSILAGANTFTGATSVTAGTLSLTGSLNGSSVATSGAGIFTEGSGGLIAGSGATFAQGSSGTSMLSGSNSYGGGTTVTAGTLQLGNAYALGTGSLTANGGVLDLHGNSETVASLSGGSGGLIETLVSGLVTLTDNGATSATYAGVISDGSGQVALVQAGAAGTLALTGNNSYSGGTTIDGTVQINTDSSLGASAGSVTINNGGTLEVLSGDTISTSRAFSLGASTTMQVDTSASYVITGNLTGASSVTLNKTGSGTLNLNGNNTGIGTTNVNAGTLIVSGELSGSVAVNSGATLGGAPPGGTAGDYAGGTISGSVTVATGGTIYPGAKQAFAGTVLAINNNLTLGASANFAVNLDANNNSDYVSITNNLTLDPSNTDTLTLDIVGAVPPSATTETYIIANYGGTESNQFGNILLTGNSAVFEGINYNVPDAYLGGDDITVTLLIVPEPGTWAMTLSGIGMLVVIQRIAPPQSLKQFRISRDADGDRLGTRGT